MNVTGEEISIRAVAEAIAAELQVSDKLVFDTTAQDGPLKRTLSDSKLRNLWPEYAPTKFQVALKVVLKRWT